MNQYIKNAREFLQKNDISYTTKFIKHDIYFQDDTEKRDIYIVIFNRKDKYLDLQFGQSIVNSDRKTPPSAYDVLSGLTKNDPETFENFCDNYGFDHDSRKAEKIYTKVCEEWKKVSGFFTEEEIEELRDIS